MAGLARADAIARLRLIRSANIGPATFAALLARFGSAAAALDAVPELARRGGGRAPVLASAAAVEAEAERVAAAGARYLFQGTTDYPARLAEVEGAPPVLIVRGDPALARRPTVAMVGARNASAAAARLARSLAAELGGEGVTIASGLARGIDTAAHQGSIDTGTVGVVGGGIDIFYPPENEALQVEVGDRGLLVAEQPPGTEPRARHFPWRNRIIAGMADATLVVEAAPKSGSLITARLAGEYGREVLAVPGSPLDPRAQGCNLLIREGATLVQTAADVLEALRPIAGAAMRAPASPPFGTAPPVAAEPGERERRTVTGLLGPTPVAADELIRQSGVSAPIVHTVLLELELAGRLDRHAGGRVSLAE